MLHTAVKKLYGAGRVQKSTADMSDYLPIVVAAPSAAREQLLQKNILPPHLFHDLAAEALWDKHSGPAIYLWPYDIPYADSDRFRDEATERVGDLPAFFGMDSEEAKDHQERMLARLLFGSIIVHVIFLDNEKTDTSPGFDERNETYAQFCTFEEIVQWSRNLKRVMEVRLLNNEANSKHILVIVASRQQVITTQKELDELNECIGESSGDTIKPFHACYFMDLNLNPGTSRKIIHSQYVWDVQVCRLLLALVLSQEKKADADSSSAGPTPLHELAGVKVWRAADCLFSLDRESCQDILKTTMEDAAKKLLAQTCDDSSSSQWLKLAEDVNVDKHGLTDALKPNWDRENEEDIAFWRSNAADSLSIRNCLHMMFYDWSAIRTESLKQDLLSPKHWEKSFEERKKQRFAWSRKNKPADYTGAVNHFFDELKNTPKMLSGFTARLYQIMSERFERQKADKERFWSEIADLEKRRAAARKKAEEDSKEFKKAQDHYVGRGLSLLVVMTMTLFLGWVIWRIGAVFEVGILPILSLVGMVLLGSFTACLLVLMLHNFTGNRAGNELVKEYDLVDQLMIDRDRKVKEMFFHGVETREVWKLQNVRFRTLLLAKRILAILETELQPQLSSLAKDSAVQKKNLPKTDAIEDKDGVREAFLKMTRDQNGPFMPDRANFKPDDIIETFFSATSDRNDSFYAVWRGICAYDTENSGYYPAKVLVSQIRAFVRFFFGHISEELLRSVDIAKVADDVLEKYFDKTQKASLERDFLSASLPDYTGEKTSYMFFSSLFPEPAANGNSRSDLKVFRSEELKNTTIIALFFQEYSVRFALQKFADAKTEYGQLSFEPRDGE